MADAGRMEQVSTVYVGLATEEFEVEDGPNLGHVMCCEDDDLALCGRDISDYGEVGSIARAETCASCLVRESNYDLCPKGTICSG